MNTGIKEESADESDSWMTRSQFQQRSTHSFYVRRSQKCKKILTTWLTLTLLGTTSVKSARKYVGEIDPRSQFHQHFMSSFCMRRSQKRKKAQKLSIFFALLGSACAKAAYRMLMKLTPGVNFINILRAAFLPLFFCQKNTKPKCN